jgi:cyclopropane fatty-acyl-phospholipid synthase-like methyltransferase
VNNPISTHSARSALNRDPDLRDWAEQFLKNKERIGRESMTAEEFEKHWRYVRPERMHDGAVEAFAAFLQQSGAQQ